jgi:hypothetical protein
MSDQTKNILKTILTIAATALLTYFGSQYLPGTEEKVTKDSTITTSVKESLQYSKFEAYMKAKVKYDLLDSLKATLKPELITVYEKHNYNLDSMIAEATREALASVAESDRMKPLAFISEADTNYVMKDSLGKTRDSIRIVSKFTSPIPLHSASQHYFGINHKSYSYDTYTEKKVETTKTITKKSFWDNVQPGLMAAYGYGIKSAKWDFFLGAGANIDIQGLIKTLGEEK